MPRFTEGESLSAGQHPGFEELLLEISTLFINLPVNSVDKVIEATQRKICESMGLDLAVLWQWSDKDANLMTITHLYTVQGGPERPAEIDASQAFPWIYQRMRDGEIMAFTNSELPDDASIDLQSRRHYGVESSVVIPLQVGGEPIIGITSFDILNREREWSKEDVKRLKLVADIFANTLIRKQTIQSLVESEERLCLATESAETGIWEFNCSTSDFWSTEHGLRIFGYNPGEPVSMTQFEKSIHPDDLEMVRQAMSESFAANKRLNVEYRITTDTGNIKWISSRGRPYYENDGTPSRMLGVSTDISERKLLEEQLRVNLNEIETLKRQIEQENYYLREDLKRVQGFEHIVGESKTFRTVLLSAKQVASTPATVLLTGETGTGKGIIANTIHQLSDRSSRSFVIVNCAALPHNLIENELFGREKGAYTSADSKQVGRFEVAHKGTIFLDEIGELTLEMQAKLLRVLQEGEFERLGSSRTVSVDVRVIAATARNLKDDVKNGRFREDLFYRLNVYPITLPPLRERKEDIPLLAQYFAERYSKKMGKRIDRVSKRMLDALVRHDWPGNIRELEHLVERSVIVSPGPKLIINEQLFPGLAPMKPGVSGGIKDLISNERDHIDRVLNLTNWKIEGPGGAAAILDIHPSTLRFRLKKLGIKRPS